MSLVSDALRKAQREAALREAKAKGLPEPLVSAVQPYRARRRRGARPLFVTLGAIALLAAGSWIALRLARPAAGPGGGAADVRNAPSTPAEAAQKGVADPDRAPGEPGATPPEPSPRPAESPSPAVTSLPPSVEAGGDLGAGEASGTTSAPSPHAPQAQPDDRVFAREADLGDGVVIRLGGIAWSEVAPLAYLNGRLAGVGESVAGWRVEAIERDRVRLAGPGGERIVVSLR